MLKWWQIMLSVRPVFLASFPCAYFTLVSATQLIFMTIILLLRCIFSVNSCNNTLYKWKDTSLILMFLVCWAIGVMWDMVYQCASACWSPLSMALMIIANRYNLHIHEGLLQRVERERARAANASNLNLRWGLEWQVVQCWQPECKPDQAEFEGFRAQWRWCCYR